LNVQLGSIVATPAAIRYMNEYSIDARYLLVRHMKGDWGDMGAQDIAANDRALATNERVMSSFKNAGPEPVWVITERDRSVTTILMPSDY
jgi:hypothetical protein